MCSRLEEWKKVHPTFGDDQIQDCFLWLFYVSSMVTTCRDCSSTFSDSLQGVDCDDDWPGLSTLSCPSIIPTSRSPPLPKKTKSSSFKKRKFSIYFCLSFCWIVKKIDQVHNKIHYIPFIELFMNRSWTSWSWQVQFMHRTWTSWMWTSTILVLNVLCFVLLPLENSLWAKLSPLSRIVNKVIDKKNKLKMN